MAAPYPLDIIFAAMAARNNAHRRAARIAALSAAAAARGINNTVRPFFACCRLCLLMQYS